MATLIIRNPPRVYRKWFVPTKSLTVVDSGTATMSGIGSLTSNSLNIEIATATMTGAGSLVATAAGFKGFVRFNKPWRYW